MAGISVKNTATEDVITFDTVAEVGSAAEFMSFVKSAWGEGLLLQPESTNALTARIPRPLPQGEYHFQPRLGKPLRLPIQTPAADAEAVARNWYPVTYGCAR